MHTRFSFDDWARWPAPLNGRLELVDGNAIVSEDDEVTEHLTLILAGTLTAGGEEPASGCGVICGPGTVLTPSLCLIDQAHAAGPDEPWVYDTSGRKRRVRVAVDVDCDASRLETLLDAGVEGAWYIDCRAELFAYQGEAPPRWLFDALDLREEPPPILN